VHHQSILLNKQRDASRWLFNKINYTYPCRILMSGTYFISHITVCSFIRIFITYVFPQWIKLLLYSETSCHISSVYHVRNHVPTTRTTNVKTHTHTQFVILDMCTNITIVKIPEPHLNHLKRSDYFMYHQLWRSKVLHGAHIAFMCYVRTSEQTAIFTSHSTNRLVS
jgi:hypothetical protein